MSIQLDLFEGKVLTNEKRLEVQKYIAECDKEVVKRQEENIITQLLLDRAGFNQGIDYVNDFKVFEKTYEHTFGYNYNNTEWIAEITVMASSGSCSILYDQLQNGKIGMGKSSVYRKGDKLECTSITSQYRYYKASSLKTKLEEHNSKIQSQATSLDKEQNMLEYTVEKYKKLYPEAKVIIGTDYNRGMRNYLEFKTVSIGFKSGSSVTFRIGHKYDEEYLHKKYDVTPMSTEQLLNHFNNQ
tara:strand:- start:52 stop:777 length:726 start_codon:yes stop_codon:yes gene_type:complete